MKRWPYKIILLSICFGIITHTQSQTNKCGWLNTINTVAPHLSHNNKTLQNSFTSHLMPQKVADADSLYTLPVVVHVIHTGSAIGSPDNPSDAAIAAMINNLNNAFRKNGVLFGGVDMRIQFQLALRSPACGVTTGINRINGSSVSNYVSGGITNNNFAGSAPETAIKKLSRWSNTDYINIWIVNKINGSSTAPGGYAYFPEYNSSITDGLVLQASVVDGTNKTIVHEMGHYFYLYHSFADGAFETTCAANTDCLTQGDLICDTEPCLVLYDCSSTTNSCSGNPFIVTDIPNNYTVLNNYMGYTNCQWMFTQGQKTRARAALFSFRNALISSGALTLPAQLLPATACTPTAMFGLSPFYGVEMFEFNTLHVYSNTSEADSTLYVDRTCNQLTSVVKGQAYPIVVAGSYGNPHRIKVFIDYNNNGNFNDAGETILNDLQGTATATVTIPLNTTANVPLRMRVLADNPALPDPNFCQLSGTVSEGAGQIEDYAIIVLKRQIVSISSGPWNVPSTWSCNCIPEGDDQVTVKATHIVTITPAMGALQCGKLTLQPGSNFNASGTGFKIVGND
jgi:hypothetical protein